MPKPRMTGLRATAVLCVVGVSAACGPREDDASADVGEVVETTLVYAGSYPVAYFADRIGGDLVEVRLPMPSGADPSTWTPSPETVLAFQEADLVLLNGAGLEAWVATASLPASRVVDTSALLADELIVVEGVTHSHGDEGEHSHGETASVTWLDPMLATRQAEAVRDALIDARPSDAARFEEGFAALAADLAEVDRGLRAVADDLVNTHFLAESPSFTYLAARYGLDVQMVAFDPTDPGASAFWHDVEHAASHSRRMLWSAPPPPDVAARLGEMGVTVIVLDATGGAPSSGDLLDAMRTSTASLAGGGATS